MRDDNIPTLLDYAKVIDWLWAERHDLGGPHREGVHMSDFPPGLAAIFEDALKRVQLGKDRDQLVDRAAQLEDLMEQHRGVLNRLEPHLGCVTCHGELVAGRCPMCQPEEFEMGDDGKLRPRRRPVLNPDGRPRFIQHEWIDGEVENVYGVGNPPHMEQLRPTRCGEMVASTLVTRNIDRINCPECLAERTA